jgi:hypothetical protein
MKFSTILHDNDDRAKTQQIPEQIEIIQSGSPMAANRVVPRENVSGRKMSISTEMVLASSPDEAQRMIDLGTVSFSFFIPTPTAI